MDSKSYIFLILAIKSSLIFGARRYNNNACNNFEDYLNATKNKNCFFNPDMLLETPGLVEKYTGKVEKHTVTTEDGYILQMFRIPRNNPKGVILFQHSLGVDSRIWVGQGNNSLAFYLWKAGYDIWMNNMRGTLFSQRHKSIPVSDFRFWDFSFNEVGRYDVPSQISLIKKVTNVPKIIYIGHSFGSTSGLIYGSALSQEAKNSVKLFVFMATPWIFKYVTNILLILRPFDSLLRSVLYRLKLGNVLFFLPILPITRLLTRLFPFSLGIINLSLNIGCGWSPEETDPALLNFDAGIYLKGNSFKSALHYLQIMSSQKFQMFDYGKEENLKRYNSTKPPLYPLENFSVPTYFISSWNDSLTTLQDTDYLLTILPKNSRSYGHLKVSDINHAHYFIGKHRENYYEELLRVINDAAIS